MGFKDQKAMHRILTKLVVALSVASVALVAADREIGTWKLNVAKSKSISPNPLRSQTDVYEATPDGGFRVTRTSERADGSTLSYSYNFKYDGKEYPVTGATYDTISAKRVDENTTVTIVKKTGTDHVETSQHVYSTDGKTKTTTVKGISSIGKPVDAIYVYDKQ